MEIYTTQILTLKQFISFRNQFNSKVGTEFDYDKYDMNSFVVTCYELEGNESQICRNIENSLN